MFEYSVSPTARRRSAELTARRGRRRTGHARLHVAIVEHARLELLLGFGQTGARRAVHGMHLQMMRMNTQVTFSSSSTMAAAQIVYAMVGTSMTIAANMLWPLKCLIVTDQPHAQSVRPSAAKMTKPIWKIIQKKKTMNWKDESFLRNYCSWSLKRVTT